MNSDRKGDIFLDMSQLPSLNTTGSTISIQNKVASVSTLGHVVDTVISTLGSDNKYYSNTNTSYDVQNQKLLAVEIKKKSVAESSTGVTSPESPVVSVTDSEETTMAVTVTYSNFSSKLSYWYYLNCINDNGVNAPQSGALDNTSVNITLTNLASNTRYSLNARLVDLANELVGSVSAEVVRYTRPKAPTFTAESTDVSEVTVVITPADSNIANLVYNVLYGEMQMQRSVRPVVVLSGLVGITQLNIVVNAQNTVSGRVSLPSELRVVDVLTLSAPTGVEVISRTATTFTVQVDVAESDQSKTSLFYNVYCVNATYGTVAAMNQTSSTVIVTGLRPDTPYDVYATLRMNSHVSETSAVIADEYTLPATPVLSVLSRMADTGTVVLSLSGAVESGLVANVLYMLSYARLSVVNGTVTILETTTIDNIATETQTIPGLLSDAIYEFWAVAFSTTVSSFCSEESVHLQSKPIIPGEPTVTFSQTTSNSLRVTVIPAEYTIPADQPKYYFATCNSDHYASEVYSFTYQTNNVFTFDGLRSNTAYQVSAQVMNVSGFLSVVPSLLPGERTLPATPELTLSSRLQTSKGFIFIATTSDEDVSQFTLSYFSTAAATAAATTEVVFSAYSDEVNVPPSTDYFLQLPNLIPNTAYSFWVTATGAFSGYASASSAILQNVYTLPAIPVVTLVAISSTSRTSNSIAIVLSSSEPTSPSPSHWDIVCYLEGTTTVAKTLRVTAMGFITLSGLTANTGYDIFATATNTTTGLTSAASALLRGVYTRPEKPTLQITSRTATTLTVTLSDAGANAVYNIYYGRTGEFYSALGQTSSVIVITDGLVANTAYELYAVVESTSPEKLTSAVSSVLRAQYTAPDAPTCQVDLTYQSENTMKVLVNSVYSTLSTTRYNVFYRTAEAAAADSSAPYLSRTGQTSSTVTLSGLAANTAYEVYATVTNSTSTFSSAASNLEKNKYTMPAKPSLRVTGRETTSFEIAIDTSLNPASHYPDRYILFYRTAASASSAAAWLQTSGTLDSTLSINNISLSSLEPNRAYELYVTTSSSVSGLSSANSDTVSGQYTKPSAPTISVSERSSNYLVVSITTTDAILPTYYNVYCGTKSLTKQPVSAGTVKITGLSSDTAYDIHATATSADSGYTSAISNQLFQEYTVPPAPTISVVSQEDTAITVTVTPPSGFVTGKFTLYVSSANNQLSYSEVVTGSGNLRVSGLTPSTAYDIFGTYTSTKSGLESVESNIESQKYTRPSTPTVRLVSREANTLTLAVDVSDTPTNYHVYYSGKTLLNLTSGNILLTGLASNTAFEIYVITSFAASKLISARSNILTDVYTLPMTPSISVRTLREPTVLTVDITAVDTDVYYNLYYGPAAGSATEALGTVLSGSILYATTTTLLVENLWSNAEYQFYATLQSKKSGLESAVSAIRSGEWTPPAVPTLNAVVARTATTMDLSVSLAPAATDAIIPTLVNISYTTSSVGQNWLLNQSFGVVSLVGLLSNKSYQLYVVAKGAGGLTSTASNVLSGEYTLPETPTVQVKKRTTLSITVEAISSDSPDFYNFFIDDQVIEGIPTKEYTITTTYSSSVTFVSAQTGNSTSGHLSSKSATVETAALPVVVTSATATPKSATEISMFLWYLSNFGTALDGVGYSAVYFPTVATSDTGATLVSGELRAQSSDSFTLSGLSSNTQYTITPSITNAAIAADEIFQVSNNVTAYTYPSTPTVDAPVSFSDPDLSASSMKFAVSTSDPMLPAYYKIKYWDDATKTVVVGEYQTSKVFLLSGLASNTLYRVIAQTKGVSTLESEWTPDASALVQYTPPLPPIVTARDFSSDGWTIDMTSLDGTTEFALKYKDDTTNQTTTVDYTNDTNGSFFVSNLTSNRKYWISGSTRGSSLLTSTWSETIEQYTTPAKPSFFQVDETTVSPTGMTVVVSANDSPSLYRLMVDSLSVWTTYQVSSLFEISGLSSNKEYTFFAQVKGPVSSRTNTALESEESDAYKQYTRPEAPTVEISEPSEYGLTVTVTSTDAPAAYAIQVNGIVSSYQATGTFILSDLLSNREYTVLGISRGPSGLLSVFSDVAAKQYTYPVAPSVEEIDTATVTDTGMTVVVTAVDNPSFYKVYYKLAVDGAVMQETLFQTEGQFILSGLSPNALYTITAKTRGPTLLSKESAAKNQYTQLSMITAIEFENTTDTSTSVTATPINANATYTVMYDTYANFTSSLSVNQDSSPFSLSGLLDANTRYYVKVRGDSTLSGSPMFVESSVFSFYTLPSTISNISFDGTTSSATVATLSPSNSNVEYTVSYGMESSLAVPYSTKVSNSNPVLIDGLPAENTRYYVKVNVKSTLSGLAASAVSLIYSFYTVLSTSLISTVTFNSTTDTGTSVLFSQGNIPNVDYTVYYSSDRDALLLATTTTPEAAASFSTKVSGNSSPISLAGQLAANTIYYVKVCGASQIYSTGTLSSNIYSFYTTPTAIGSVTFVDTTETGTSVVFSPVSANVEYTVTYSTDPTFTTSFATKVGTTSPISLEGLLTSNTKYYVKIRGSSKLLGSTAYIETSSYEVYTSIPSEFTTVSFNGTTYAATSVVFSPTLSNVLYTIRYGTDPAMATYSTSAGSATSPILLSSLTSNTRYYVKICSASTVAGSAVSVVSTATYSVFTKLPDISSLLFSTITKSTMNVAVNTVLGTGGIPSNSATYAVSYNGTWTLESSDGSAITLSGLSTNTIYTITARITSTVPQTDAATVYSQTYVQTTAKTYHDGSSLAPDWTTVAGTGTAIATSTAYGNPGSSYALSNNGGYMYLNLGSSLLNSYIAFDAYCPPTNYGCPDFYFACNGTGSGQMFRTDFTATTGNSGFAATSSWTSRSAATTGIILSRSTWYRIYVSITSGGAATYYIYKISDGSLLSKSATTYTVANNGTYIGVQCDAGGGPTYYDNISVYGGEFLGINNAATTPTQPTSIAVGTITDSTVSLTVNANAGNSTTTAYAVTYTTGTTTITTPYQRSTSFILTGLIGNSYYSVYATAKAENGLVSVNSASNNFNTTISTITAVTFTNITSNGMDVSFSPINSNVTYTVMYGTSSTLATYSSVVGTAPPISLSGLASGTQYYVKISTTSTLSPPTTLVSSIYSSYTLPDSPVLSVTSISNTMMTVTFTNYPSGLSSIYSYTLVWTATSTGGTGTTVMSTTLPLNVIGMTKNTAYTLTGSVTIVSSGLTSLVSTTNASTTNVTMWDDTCFAEYNISSTSSFTYNSSSKVILTWTDIRSTGSASPIILYGAKSPTDGNTYGAIPTYTSTGVNYGPAISFWPNNTRTYLYNSISSTTMIRDITIGTVFQFTDLTGISCYMSSGELMIYINGASNMTFGISGRYGVSCSTITTLSANTPYMMVLTGTYIASADGTTAAYSWKLRINKKLINSGTTTSITAIKNSPMGMHTNIYLGGAPSSSYQFKGYLDSFLLFNSVLSDTHISSLEDYLMTTNSFARLAFTSLTATGVVVTISQSTVTGAKYMLYYGTTASGTFTSIASQTSNVFTIATNTLAANTSYEFYGVVQNSSGTDLFKSITYTTFTLPVTPSVSVSSVTTTGMSVTLTSATSVTYVLYYNDVKVESATNTFSLAGLLTSNTQYAIYGYCVSTVSGSTAVSANSTTTLATTLPTAPTGLAFSGITNTKMTVTVSPSTITNANYVVYYNGSNVTIPSSGNEITLTLTANTTYTIYALTKSTLSGTPSSSNSTSYTKYTLPNPATAMSFSSYTTTGMTVTITPTTLTNSNYRLTYNGGASYITQSTNIFYLDTLLAENTRYSMDVNIVSTVSGSGAVSSTLSQYGYTLPSAPTALAFASSSMTEIQVTVTPATILNGGTYVIYYNGVAWPDSTSNVVLLTGLSVTTTYSIYAAIRSSVSGSTQMSAVSSTYTTYTMPGKPILEVTNVTNTSVEITFTNYPTGLASICLYTVYWTNNSTGQSGYTPAVSLQPVTVYFLSYGTNYTFTGVVSRPGGTPYSPTSDPVDATTTFVPQWDDSCVLEFTCSLSKRINIDSSSNMIYWSDNRNYATLFSGTATTTYFKPIYSAASPIGNKPAILAGKQEASKSATYVSNVYNSFSIPAITLRNITVALVYRPLSSISLSYSYGGYNYSYSATFLDSSTITINGNPGYFVVGIGGKYGITASYTLPSYYDTNFLFVFTAAYSDDSNGTTATYNWTLRINRAQVNTGSVSYAAIKNYPMATPATEMWVAGGHQGNQITNGYMGSLTICNTVLSSDEIIDLENYLSIAHGLTYTAAPMAPAGVTASSITTTSITITVTAASDNPGYYALIYINNVTKTSTTTAYQTSKIFSISGLTSNTQYTIYAKARTTATGATSPVTSPYIVSTA